MKRSFHNDEEIILRAMVFIIILAISAIALWLNHSK